MNTYKRHRFRPEIISYAVWYYYRFNLGHSDIEDLLAKWHGGSEGCCKLRSGLARRVECETGAQRDFPGPTELSLLSGDGSSSSMVSEAAKPGAG